MIDIYLTIIAGLFGLYALACSVECGLSIKMLAGDKSAASIFTPLWEVTNVFLVFGFTGVAVIFNGGLQAISHALLSTLAVALVSLLLRACLALGLFYNASLKRSGWLLWLFLLASLATPLSFAAAGAYLLTGQLFWHTLVGLTLVVAALFGLVSAGLAVANRLTKQPDHALVEPAYLLWLIGLGSVLPLAIRHSDSLLQTGPIEILTLMALVSILLVLAKFVWRLRWTWLSAPVLILTAPVLLAWANRPYVISGQLPLSQAYGAQAFASIFLVGSLIILPLLIVGFWMLIKLWVNPPKP